MPVAGNSFRHADDMQDKYAGDVGDFGKIILLNRLHELVGQQGRLGINWYRVARPEKTNRDGGFIEYLDEGSRTANLYRKCDPIVYRKLKELVHRNRSICTLEASGVFPKNMVFFSEPLTYGSQPIRERPELRKAWHSKAVRMLSSARIIFLDPDNGIQTANMRETRSRSIKYALNWEIHDYCKHADIVIVYNHRVRTKDTVYNQKFERVLKPIEKSIRLRVLRFRRVSVRDYAFFFKARSAAIVEQLFRELTSQPFDFLFQEYHVN